MQLSGHRGYYTVARRYEFYVLVARTISHSCLCNNMEYITSHFKSCVWQEITSDKWEIKLAYHTNSCITFLYHAIENTVTNTNNPTYARRMMGRLGVISSKIQRLSWLAVFSKACSSNKAILGIKPTTGTTTYKIMQWKKRCDTLYMINILKLFFGWTIHKCPKESQKTNTLSVRCSRTNSTL